MGRIEKSIEIRAPPENVWEKLALDKMPEWKEGCKNVMFTSTVQTPKDKYKVGATAHFIDQHSKLMMTIVDSLENKKITYRLSGTLRARNIYLGTPRARNQIHICSGL